MAPVSDIGIPQVCIFPVGIIKHAHPGRIGVVSRCSAGKQIPLSLPFKVGGRFSCQRRKKAVVMDAVIPRHIRIVFCQIRADQLEVGPLEPDISLSIRIRMEAEVSCIHIQGLYDPVDKGIGAFEVGRDQNAHELADLASHDLEPGHVQSCLFAVKDMGPVHAVGGMERAGQVFGLGRNDQAPVVPVHKVPAGIEADAPVPDISLTVGPFLVLSVPVPELFLLVPEDGKAVSLDRLSGSIQPYPAGSYAVISHAAYGLPSLSSAWPSFISFFYRFS